MHYYIDTRTLKRKRLPAKHLKNELDILPVISHTLILIDCKLLRKKAKQKQEETFLKDVGFTMDDIPF